MLRKLSAFERDDLLMLIRKYWILNSDLRLGQMLINIAGIKDLYYIEDRELLKLLKKEFNKENKWNT